jgi:SWIM zinc finger
MTTNGSVYPSAVADKCVELLCTRHHGLQQAASYLTAARYLMMQGCVEPQDGKNWKSACFAVLSPDTPRFYYAVDLRSETCTCAYFLRYQKPCKHIFAVVLTPLAQRRLHFTPRTETTRARAK